MSSDDCTVCGGTFCPVGSTEATPCAAGTFNSSPSRTSASCPAGEYQDEVGQMACTMHRWLHLCRWCGGSPSRPAARDDPWHHLASEDDCTVTPSLLPVRERRGRAMCRWHVQQSARAGQVCPLLRRQLPACQRRHHLPCLPAGIFLSRRLGRPAALLGGHGGGVSRAQGAGGVHHVRRRQARAGCLDGLVPPLPRRQLPDAGGPLVVRRLRRGHHLRRGQHFLRPLRRLPTHPRQLAHDRPRIRRLLPVGYLREA